MTFKPRDYNKQFLANPGAMPDAILGVSIDPADVSPGKPYWKIIGIHHLTGPENMGNHNAYCDVLDEQGNRIDQARLVLEQDGQPALFAVVDKPAEEAGTNFPLWKSTLAKIKVQAPAHDPLPSDQVLGIRSTHPDEEIGNTWGHHSFYIVWQWTTAGSEPGPQPEPQPEPEPTPEPGVPGWREKFTANEEWLIRQYQLMPNSPTALLVVKLVKVLNGKL